MSRVGPYSFASLKALIGVVGTMGCDRVYGLEREPDPEETCGDGRLSNDEDCDDGSNAGGDGCDSTCRIEPNFECPPGEVCLPVVGLSRGPIGRRLEAVGSVATGNPYAFECPVGEVMVGFEGYVDQTMNNLGSLQAVCGSLGLAPNGQLLVTQTSTSATWGAEQNGAAFTVMCAQDELAIGFIPSINVYVSGFEWICQRVSHTNGDLRFGESRMLSFGPSKGIQGTSQRCSSREVVSEVSGRAGTSVDSIRFGCSEISTVLCGDNMVVAPETCDDGNLLRHDGCDARCQRE